MRRRTRRDALGRRLVVSNLHGRALLARTIAAGSRLEDLDRGLLVYSVENTACTFSG